LPKDVSKGPSLKRLVAHLGIDETRVLAAGDTLNDLSMLECGIQAVAVGGAEAALLDRVSGLEHVFTATEIGAAGILEAVAALDLHPTPKG
jgi:hydroxymethylpyrimidine pyrophosphatase-like HAD family hydrolase